MGLPSLTQLSRRLVRFVPSIPDPSVAPMRAVRRRAIRSIGGTAVLTAALLLAATPVAPQLRDAAVDARAVPVRMDPFLRDTTEQDTSAQDTAAHDRAARSGAADSHSASQRSLRTPGEPPSSSLRPVVASGRPAPRDTVRRDTIRQDTTERDTTRRGAARGDTLPGGRRTVPVSPSQEARPARRKPLLDDAPTSDTLASDSLASDTLYRVQRYRPSRQRGSALFPAPPASGRTANLLRPRSSFWHVRPSTRYEHRLTLDSTGRAVTARERVGNEALAAPLRVDRTTYRRARRDRDLRANWTALRREHERRRNQQRRGLGMSIDVPGGRQSAFTTIFGKNEVSLDINGQADIDAGFDYRRSDQQAQLTGSPTQLDPDFKQDLRLGITGTIGDKLQIDVNWDTQSQFDYQNQLKLQYTGYEDEIIQRVEAGNVFLNTPSTLIDGGQSLFGIKSEFQLGGLRLTTIASQQEGQSNTLSIEGGSEKTEFDFSALDYDDRRHFFLSYYFRNNWNRAHSDPQALITGINGFDRITDLEVWKIKTTEVADEQLRDVVALVDLGEPKELLEQADEYDASGEEALPANDNDQYTVSTVEDLRSTNAVDDLLQGNTTAEPPYDYQQGEFKLLELDPQRGDYTFDDELGYLTLQQSLRENEALAVAFRYRANGRTHQVGDFASEVGDGRLVLKLLRPANLPAPADEPTAAWYLQLRNIYELRGRNFNEDGFELNLQYDPPGGTPQSSLPGVGGRNTLLQLLGLDRLDTDGSPSPNGKFDFLRGRTIDQQNGLLIFPYLQPFGARLRQVIEEEGGAGQSNLDEYVFSQLYTDKPDRLESENTEADRYRIAGASKGTVPEFYDLKAFNGVVEGSVRVTADGTPLKEGTDYQVDYQSGTVNITNDRYLSAGSEIEIDYEKNALVNFQKKTLLGARADYRFRDQLTVGATVMRLSQRSPADKLRIGQEPIKNTIWGMDAALELEPRWLTRAVDALPLIQTKARSALTLNAEFAQLRPSHTETQAFERTRRDLQREDRDFTDDELRGISYVDDFEGFENSFSLKAQLQGWRLAAPPTNYDAPTTPDSSAAFSEALAANNWRGTLAWYQLNKNIVEALADVPSYDAGLKERVDVLEVFPNRDTRGQVDNTLRTLDLYFDPRRRGPYNYTEDLRYFLGNPEDAWGGMTQRLPEGQTDFGVKNIEFVEFVFKPTPKGGAAADSAALYLDLGSVSEDLIPNGEQNDEDGLSITSFDNFGPFGRSREPVTKANDAVDIEGDVTEDLGLDGLASYAGSGGAALYGDATEQATFNSFIGSLPSAGAGRLRAEAARARHDPSGDDYHSYEDDRFFENSSFFPGGASFQERFAFYQPGLELNSYQAQNTLSSEFTSGRGVTRDPDAENFAFDRLNQQGDYFQYRIPLNEKILKRKARPDTPDDFIVGEIKNPDTGEGTGWYQARIPVRAPTDSIGAPDLSFVEHMRLWTTGHRAPITLRFATLELVGSQWRKSERVALTDEEEEGAGEEDPEETPDDAAASIDDSRLTIASINNEEDSGLYKRPLRAIVGQQRLATGGQQNTREQSLVLRVEDLRKGQRRAIFKNVQNLNLLKYGGLRMFAHLHSSADDFGGLDEEAARGQVELFVRLGANETQDYYEYRQPLTPTLGELSAASVERLWYPLDAAQQGLANEMNLRLTALNQLKVARDRADDASLDEVFWSHENAKKVNLDPALQSFAPAGARIGVKGTPSLQNVSTVVVGLRVRDKADRDRYRDLTLWINELRATGYDEKNGWKARASARIDLADVADVQANFERQTDGWGALASTLDERRQNRLLNWNVNTTLYADKLLPASSGWRIPVTFEMGSRTSTPRYAPNRGDVRLDAILDQIQAGDDSGLTEEVVRRAAQTHTTDRRVHVSLQKSGSSSPWLHYTLDQFNLVYNLSQTSARTPSRRLDDGWNWSADVEYDYQFERPHTVRPFWFLEGVPLVDGLGRLRMNYAPQSVGFDGNLTRDASQQQDRSSRLFTTGGDELREPIRDQHSFTHERGFNLQYNPFDFLRLSFNTRTDQSFNRLGAREQFRLVRPGQEDEIFDTREGAESKVDSSDAAFVEQRLDVYDVGTSFQRLFSGAGPRTNDYAQRFTASFDLPFGDSEALNWIDFQDVSYRAIYNWRNGPRERNLGANVQNDVTISSGISLHPQQLWRKFEFYRRLEKQQEEAERAAEEEARKETPSEEAEGEGAPSEAAPSDTTAIPGEPGEEEGERSGRERSFSDLPLPNPLHLLRRVALAITGIRDFTVQYDASRTARSSNVGLYDGERETLSSGSHTLLGALRGEGPPLGYRFGFGRRIRGGLRPPDSSLYTLEDRLVDGSELRARTTVQFSEDLQINLNWSMNWDRTTTYSNVGGSDETRTLRGSNASSVWAIGGGYRAFFERQLEALEGDRRADAPGADGYVTLTNASLSEDFRKAFISSMGTVGKAGFLSLPLPSWRVTYSGLSDWPLLGALTQSVRLTHGYTADYASDYRSTAVGEDRQAVLQLGTAEFAYAHALFDSQRQSVQERYQPLVGLDVSWKGALSTNLKWNRTNAFALRPASEEIAENRSNEISLTADYRKQGLDIPFLPFGDLNNQITFSLTASRTVNRERDFLVREALTQALNELEAGGSYDPTRALEGENVSVRVASTRLQVAPSISYRFSNRISAEFVLRYERFEGNRRPSYSNIDGGFNVRVSLQE